MQSLLTAQVQKAETFAKDKAVAALGVAIVLVVIGGSAVAVALQDSHPVLALFGIFVLAIGLGFVHKAGEFASKPKRWPWAVAAATAIALGGCIAARALERDLLLAGTGGAAVGVIGVLGAASTFHEWTSSGPRWLTFVGPLIAAVGYVLAATGGLAVAAGVVLLLAGIASYKVGLRSACQESNQAAVVPLAGAVVFIAGVALMGVASARSSTEVAAPAGLLAVMGLIALSEGWPAVGIAPFRPLAVQVVGLLVVVVTSALVMLLSGLPKGGAGLACLLAAAIGASFVWRGEGVVVLTVLVVAFSWLLVDRIEEGSTDPHPSAKSRILAVGDSYMSGEGAPVFFEGTNNKGDHANECRRAPTAYPVLVATRLDMGLDFFACSGARARQLWAEAQMPGSPARVPGGKAQLHNLRPEDIRPIKAVLVSIGGNDADFGVIGRGCVVPGACDELRGLWQAGLDQVVDRAETAYREIKAKVEDVPVIVVPYPLLLRTEGCGWSPLEPSEHEFLANFITLLNERIQLAAARAGIHFFHEGLHAFEGHRICDGKSPDDTVMNFINVNPVRGELRDRLSPRNWMHGSLHPSPDGHELVAQRLVPFVADLIELTRDGHPANPEPNPNISVEELGRSGATTEIFDPGRLPRGGDIKCATVREIDPFATRVQLFGDRAAVTVDGDPTQPLCYTDKGGEWVQLAAGEMDPGVPTVPAEVPLDEDQYEQYVVYRDSARGWRLRILAFCKPDPSCPDNARDWTNEQLAKSVEYATPPFLLLLTGGWLLAVGGTSRLKPSSGGPLASAIGDGVDASANEASRPLPRRARNHPRSF